MLLALLLPSKGPRLCLLLSVFTYLFTQDPGIEVLTKLKQSCSLE